jgi:transketolase
MVVPATDLRPGGVYRRAPQRRAPEVDVERLSIDTIRTLAMDMVEAAGSGHPGTPLALAPLVHLLFTRYLKHDPADPDWVDRDRFVLSAGHASALLYAILHLTGYHLGLDELSQFRRWGSRTPDHAERGMTPGVQVTTGSLGQGVGNAVGMALAERLLAARFNRPGHEIIDHRTWVIASDGDLMEGASGEAVSLAGHLGLGKLVVFYDDNRITTEGCTELAFSESVTGRFEAYGWQVLTVADVNDVDALSRAIDKARADVARPSLVVVRSTIAYGAPTKQRTAAAHGAPLGGDEVDTAKEQLGWPYPQPFAVPATVRMVMARVRARGERRHQEWETALLRYQQDRPDLGAELDRVLAAELPAGWEAALPTHFGASAPAGVLFERFGFTPAGVAERARALLDREGRK